MAHLKEFLAQCQGEPSLSADAEDSIPGLQELRGWQNVAVARDSPSLPQAETRPLDSHEWTSSALARGLERSSPEGHDRMDRTARPPLADGCPV